MIAERAPRIPDPVVWYLVVWYLGFRLWRMVWYQADRAISTG